ncbi:hypothetical protein IEQ34_018383 [Dendrobium chrysotoxum]|uniref:Uncharacterized protein n=1 Tax=Dendrobium chrysotoxum TaxID=161865 RepID=A0AAV7GDT4_DENCH|nr:hypothetical protein IEQ34_018383 [Dendrobium chrysotoxum]
MSQNPEAKEQSANQFAPLRNLAVERPRYADEDCNDVDSEDSERRDEESGPLDYIEVGEEIFIVLVSRFGGESERDVDAGNDFEKALEDGGEVGRGASDDPELFVAPVFFEGDARPFDFEDGEEGEGEGDEEQVDEEGGVEGLDDEFAGKEGDSGKKAVDDEEDGSEGVDTDVDVGDALEEFQAGAREQSIVLGEEDLYGPCSPPQHLMQAVCQVDRCSPSKRVTFRNAIH